MISRTTSLLLFGVAVLHAQAQTLPTDLVGTWNSKSNSTTTGPDFYDPTSEQFTEPKLTGISYSFTADGFFEEAYYRAIPNPQDPACPKGIMQWQHGSFQKLDNGSLTLSPIQVDGRQLYSDPCEFKSSLYTRYNASELFQRYEVLTDPYHNIPRLNLYKFDGSPLMPLYLAMTPPKMLPTTTLNPITTQTAKPGKLKRGELPMNHEVVFKRTPAAARADTWWWFGVFLTVGGGFLYFFF